MGLTTLIFHISRLTGRPPPKSPLPLLHTTATPLRRPPLSTIGHIRIPVSGKGPDAWRLADLAISAVNHFTRICPRGSGTGNSPTPWSYHTVETCTDTTTSTTSPLDLYPQMKLPACAAKQGECDDNEGPVCGTDGQTYPTRCHLLRAQCGGHQVSLKYSGSCNGKCQCITYITCT